MFKIIIFLNITISSLYTGDHFNEKIKFISPDVKIDSTFKSQINKSVVIIENFFKSIYPKTIKIKYPPIYIYENKKRFNILAFKTINDSNVLGFYSRKKNEIHVYFTKNLKKTCFHEVCHSVFIQNFPSPPNWLSEGISEYFENLMITSDTSYIFADKVKEIKFIKIIKSNYRKFRKIFFLQDEDFFEYKNSYLISWGIINFLVNYRLNFLKIIFQNINTNKTIITIRKEYQGGFKQLWRDIITVNNSE